MPASVFECPTNKCGYAIATDDLNKIQLEALDVGLKDAPSAIKALSGLKSTHSLIQKQLKPLEGKAMIVLAKLVALYLKLRVKNAGHTGMIDHTSDKVIW